MTKLKTIEVEDTSVNTSEIIEDIINLCRRQLTELGSIYPCAYGVFKKDQTTSIAVIPRIGEIACPQDKIEFVQTIKETLLKVSEESGLELVGVILTLEAWALSRKVNEVKPGDFYNISDNPDKQEVVVFSVEMVNEEPRTIIYGLERNPKLALTADPITDSKNQPGTKTTGIFTNILC